LICYLDTSLVVAALTNEIRTASVQAWLGGRQSDAFLVSDWVTAEFSAALSIKLRNGQIDESARAQALGGYGRLLNANLAVLPVTAQQFHTAARMADRYDLGLRAADALHLAIAAEYGATLCTLDQRQREAGPAIGVMTLLV